MDHYDNYPFTPKENLIYILQGLLLIIMISIVFYQSIIAVLFLSPMIYFYRRSRMKQFMKERKWQLNLEFRDGIISLAAALNAGYSSEHAFEEAFKDLSRVYKEDSMIMKEFYYIVNQIRMNITVEKALSEFGDRSGIDDIISFSEVFTTAKRTGGDLIKIINTTCNTISDKIEVKREIITLITAKRFEANIMKVIPIGILIFLKVSSPGYLDPLYHNAAGIIMMTIILGVYLSAVYLIDRIIDIEL